MKRKREREGGKGKEKRAAIIRSPLDLDWRGWVTGLLKSCYAETCVEAQIRVGHYFSFLLLLLFSVNDR